MKKRRMHLANMIVLILFPYLITVLFNSPEVAVINRKADPEAILPFIVKTQISSSYEEETLKAQAVIARSNLYRRLEGKESLGEICKELKKMIPDIWGIIAAFSGRETRKFEEAVKGTTGKVLVFNGELKLIPYHEISAGQTRDGSVAFHNQEYAYLEGVDSGADKSAPDYLSSTYVARQQLPEELKITEREESGYVVSLSADENIMEAESFVLGMGIASSDFSIQRIGDRVRFFCKGRGHGLGFSQYGGNELAKEGKTWKEILNVYFPLLEIEEDYFSKN